VRVAHEALFRNWSMLHNWLNAAKQDLQLLSSLRVDAQAWERIGPDKGADMLWRGQRLQQARRLLTDAQPELLHRFLNVSRNEELNKLQDDQVGLKSRIEVQEEKIRRICSREIDVEFDDSLDCEARRSAYQEIDRERGLAEIDLKELKQRYAHLPSIP
jgi:hypothetical protein